MNKPIVDKIVAALLYEGYILYPYRPSVKNRQRWTFGGLYPPSYCQAEGGSESSIMQTQCLVVGDNRTRLDVNVRCLHLVERTVGEPVAPLSRLPEDKEPPLKIVAELQVGEKILQSWQEAMQEEIPVSACELGMLSEPLSKAFRLPGFRKFEGVAGPGGDIAAVIVRQQQPVEGCVELSALQLTEELFRVSIRISNQTPLHEGTSHTRDQALMHALVST